MPLKKTFKDLVDDAKSRITQTSPDELAAMLAAGGDVPVIIDVREAGDYSAGHIAGAKSVARGRLELDIDEVVPDTETPIILYCGGGSRGALSTDTLQTMGYTNVSSLAGGFRAWSSDPAKPVSTPSLG